MEHGKHMMKMPKRMKSEMKRPSKAKKKVKRGKRKNKKQVPKTAAWLRAPQEAKARNAEATSWLGSSKASSWKEMAEESKPDSV